MAWGNVCVCVFFLSNEIRNTSFPPHSNRRKNSGNELSYQRQGKAQLYNLCSKPVSVYRYVDGITYSVPVGRHDASACRCSLLILEERYQHVDCERACRRFCCSRDCSWRSLCRLHDCSCNHSTIYSVTRSRRLPASDTGIRFEPWRFLSAPLRVSSLPSGQLLATDDCSPIPCQLTNDERASSCEAI